MPYKNTRGLAPRVKWRKSTAEIVGRFLLHAMLQYTKRVNLCICPKPNPSGCGENVLHLCSKLEKTPFQLALLLTGLSGPLHPRHHG
jgi:hypothetical protein